jgi:hypothetical protein
MNVEFRCPDCQATVRAALEAGATALPCQACGAALPVPSELFEGPRLRRCAVCPSTDLYLRKDFPQRLGVGLVVVGFVASSVAWYFYMIYWAFGILFATALIDVLLYTLVGESLTCYRCGAQYRGGLDTGQRAPFRLETHERHRQQQARLEHTRQASQARAVD